MLTEQEIWQAIEHVRITRSYVVDVARAIEAKVLEKQAAEIDSRFAAAHYQDGRDLMLIPTDSHAPPVGVPHGVTPRPPMDSYLVAQRGPQPGIGALTPELPVGVAAVEPRKSLAVKCTDCCDLGFDGCRPDGVAPSAEPQPVAWFHQHVMKDSNGIVESWLSFDPNEEPDLKTEPGTSFVVRTPLYTRGVGEVDRG